MRESDIRSEKRRTGRNSKAVRWGLIGLTAVATTLLALVELNLLRPPTWAALTVILLVAVVAAAAPSLSLHAEGAAKREDRHEADLLKIATGLIYEIHNATSLPIDQIGVSVWSVYRPKSKSESESLARLVRQRISPHPQASNESWTKGRGVIGACWEKEDTVFQEWRTAQREHSGRDSLSKAQWKKVESGSRAWGFGQSDYLRAIRKYDEVLAVPIKEPSGAFIGCVSVDLPCLVDGGCADGGAEADDSMQVDAKQDRPASLGAHPVRVLVASAAENLRAIVGPA